MSQQLVVREVRAGDAPGLHAGCLSTTTLERVERLVAENLGRDRYVHLVAELDGQIVATVELAGWKRRRARHRGELFRFVVAESYRGRGVARALLREVVKRASDMGIETLDTSARAGTPAEDVFRKLGFEEFGRLPGAHEERSGARVDMVMFYLPVWQALETQR